MLIGVVAFVSLVPLAADRVSGAMETWPLLSLVTFLPLVGVLFILVLRGEAEAVARNARWIALWTSLIDLRAVARRSGRISTRRRAEFQFVEQADWLPGFNITYHMGDRRHLAVLRAAVDAS